MGSCNSAIKKNKDKQSTKLETNNDSTQVKKNSKSNHQSEKSTQPPNLQASVHILAGLKGK